MIFFLSLPQAHLRYPLWPQETCVRLLTAIDILCWTSKRWTWHKPQHCNAHFNRQDWLASQPQRKAARGYASAPRERQHDACVLDAHQLVACASTTRTPGAACAC